MPLLNALIATLLLHIGVLLTSIESLRFQQITYSADSYTKTNVIIQNQTKNTKHLSKNHTKLKVIESKKSEELKKSKINELSFEEPKRKANEKLRSGQQDIRAFYVSKIRAMVEDKKKYPTLAKKLKQQGKVKIILTLNSEGELKEFSYLEKSSYQLLNNAVEKAVYDVDQYPSIPKELASPSAKIILNFDFILI